MPEQQKICATDQELFDVLMGTKRRFSVDYMLEMGRERGIFYSAEESRESLASALSLLPYSFRQVAVLLEHRETMSRSEKTTHVSLGIPANMQLIKQVADAYKETKLPGDDVMLQQRGPTNFVMTVRYSEIDHSKTRLVQRREKEAEIEFILEPTETTVRMPANEKATEILAKLKQQFDQRLPQPPPMEAVELSDITDPKSRSDFFMALISEMHGFRFKAATSIKVQSNIAKDEDDPFSDESKEDDGDDGMNNDAEAARMLSVLTSVAFRGMSLESSEEYQALREKGFYITSIIWRGLQQTPPNYLVEFEAGFDEPRGCTRFRYNVRGVAHLTKKGYTRTFKAAEATDKLMWLGVIEESARTIMHRLRAEANATNTSGGTE